MRPGIDQVLIEIFAAGVNRADLLQAAGNYPPPPGASDILGLEVSGRIAAVGDGVSEWIVGQEVCALLAGGDAGALFAEFTKQWLYHHTSGADINLGKWLALNQ